MARLQGRKPAPLGRESLSPEQPVKLPANERFLLLAHPRQWTLLEGQVVPFVARLSVAPGVSLVDRRGGLTEALNHKQKRGWIVLPENVANPDDPDETYLRVYDGEHGPVWCTQWEQVFPGAKTIRSDVAAYVAFLRDLMERGIIPQPEPWVLEEMRARKEQLHAQMLDQAEAVPSARPAAERLADEIAILDAELERLQGAAAKAKPAAGSKPKRRAKSEPEPEPQGEEA